MRRPSAFWLIYFVSTGFVQAQVPHKTASMFQQYIQDSLSISIEIPDYMVEVNTLDKTATWQFANIFNETYLMVILEEKCVQNHATLQALQDDFKDKLQTFGADLVGESFISVGQRNAFESKVILTVDGVELAYLVVFIDTDDVLYKFYSWTTKENSDYLTDFAQASRSFTTLN